MARDCEFTGDRRRWLAVLSLLEIREDGEGW
jgi:hypothetical protein